MFHLLERLESMGKAGAPVALAVAAALLAAAIALAVWSTRYGGPDPSGHGVLLLRGAAFAACGFAMVFGLVGARAWTAPTYPDPSEVFPSMSPADFERALTEMERPIVVCAACRIVLEARFDSGGCPRCSSSVDWHRIDTDEDADLVRAASRGETEPS